MQGSRSDDRLFVALNSEHYENFASGAKEWELRGVNHLFNSNTVQEGKMAELRRGYNTDDSLWGPITDVEEFRSLLRVPDRIDHELILPGSTRVEFLESARSLIGDYDEYIAFRVDVESI